MSTNGFHRTSVATLTFLLASSIIADDRGRVALDIDGLVRVAGLPSTGTEVYIIPAEGRVEHMTDGFQQFTRELDLQTTYLLSFEREGCLTKQVYIDTHVPQSFMSLSPFEFRFKVTLRGQERQGERYAGPVAFVRFNAGLSDFDYETDYRMLRDSTVFERLEMAHELGPDHPALAFPARVRVPVVGATDGVQEASMPAAEAVVEHLVTERRVTRLGVDRAAPDPPSPPTSAPMNEELPQDLPNGPHVGMEVTTAPAEEDLDLPVEGLRPRTIVAEGRSEELVVERLRVTTIVRVVLNDVTTEYRRVAHYHGGVTHFMNGSPCSEAVYREGTGH